MTKTINVLSCFDGISCGQLALQRAEIKVDNYYASEINEDAIKVTKKNFPNTHHIGDVTNVTSAMLGKIDLLLGGSPCVGFSLTGHKLGFKDPRSNLFVHYHRLLTELKPKHFLFENVTMQKKHQDMISEYLQCEPVIINSSKFSAQLRRRLYWSNINFDVPTNNHPQQLNDILEYGKSDRKKSLCLLAGYADKTVNPCDVNRYYTKYIHQLIPDSGNYLEHRRLTPIECERLQTLPDNYTSGIPDKERIRAIGNAWTVDLITHILKHIKE